MSRRSLLALLAIPVFFLAAIPAAFAKKATTSAAPEVTSIKPLKLKIGEKLTIHGKNFIKGKHKNTIVFMGAGKRVVWVKADTGSKNTLTVKLPTRLAVLLADKSGKQQPTRLLIRVIAKKSARAFTKRGESPVVSPNATIQSGAPQAEACPGVSVANGDSDGDLLSNGLELALGTNPCSADSDGDGVSDGYEYQSALDLNRTAGTSTIPWPYPGKRPYPNPLDKTDASVDFDGDGLTLSEEYLGSVKLGFSNLSQVHYSDGKQMTVATPAPAADGYQDNGAAGPSGTDIPRYHNDYNADGFLSDDEQDADGDGLSNWAETHGYATEKWWASWSGGKKPTAEAPYTLRPFGVLDWLDPDTDGDGVLDGADDQDQDGLTNLQEQARNFVFYSGEPYDRRLAINPFNPCLPNPSSPSCTKYVPFGAAVTPFEADSPPLPDALFPDFPAPYSWPQWWIAQS
jgi:hypothetical protein